MAAIGFGAAACSTNPKPNLAPRRPPVSLAPVKASWDRIIRTTVGLRPHRDAGFVLKPDKLDDKLLVHNYGHGGAGMSLAWGTGLAQPCAGCSVAVNLNEWLGTTRSS